MLQLSPPAAVQLLIGSHKKSIFPLAPAPFIKIYYNFNEEKKMEVPTPKISDGLKSEPERMNVFAEIFFYWGIITFAFFILFLLSFCVNCFHGEEQNCLPCFIVKENCCPSRLSRRDPDGDGV